MELIIASFFCTLIIAFLIGRLIDSIKNNKTFDDDPILLIVLLILNIIIGICIISVLNKPKAIDVYQKETTLEITYKDNVPIDSVVVWKDK